MSTPPSPTDPLGGSDYLLEAEQQWEAQGISPEKLTEFSRRSSPVVDQEVVENAPYEQVERALRPLVRGYSRRALPKVSAHAVAMYVSYVIFRGSWLI